MTDEHINTELNDRTIRIVMIPFFGIVIPNATGMIDNGMFTGIQLLASYLYFTFISFSLWHGNRYLLFRLRIRFSWLSQPVYKVVALIVSNIFYTIPICVGLMTAWYVFAVQAAADWNVIFKATALCVVCVVFITHTYETVFLIKSWESDKTKSELLTKAKVEAELEALKNQIDPHFMFNSLNTLSYLIETEPAKAKLFNDNLAEVFRYILYNKERHLVLLSEEMAFVNNYFTLITIRFGGAVALNIVPHHCESDTLLIPPISLQVLLENAIKHNEFSERHPLTVTIEIRNDAVLVSNVIRRKSVKKQSAHIGLQNLRERYLLTMEKEISVRAEGTMFVVTLPLLTL